MHENENVNIFDNKDKQINVYKILVPWTLFTLGLLTVIYPRFTNHPLFPVYQYGNLRDFAFWQIPFVYIYSYCTRAWGALLFAFMLGGIISGFVPRDKMTKYMASKNISSYFLAALAAPLLTVCSCAMIPIFGGLLISGSGIGPALTFLLMAPAANILALIFTWEIISWRIAVFRFVFSFVGAILIGWILSKTQIGKKVEEQFSGIEKMTADNIVKKSFEEKSWKALLEAWDLAKKVIPYLFAGVFVVSFIEAYLPPQLVAHYLKGTLGVVLGTVIGVPTYTPTLVEVFLIKAMLKLGMEPAAALAFLIGAPMASIPSMMGVSKIVGWNLVIRYAVLSIIVAAIAGLVYLNTVVIL